MVRIEEYEGRVSAWCPGCGNFGILGALKEALVQLNKQPHEVLIVSGIGQAAKLPHYLKCNTLNGLHGRSLPPATGAKLANPWLTVFAVGGDGDGYGEGGNHFLHTARRNPDITYLVHDNLVYALTKGQASPTSELGFVTKLTPHGATMPLNPLAVAIAAEATFVARGYVGDQEHLVQLICKGVQHKGFSLIDILQPCVSYNHKNTYEWYSKRVYRLDGEKDYNPGDRFAAFKKSQEWGDRIPIGVIYQGQRPTLEDNFPALKAGPLTDQSIDPKRVGALLEQFT
ncbi:MAG: thiamine pyrophosphate-dependent enzyme [Dehalococcoidia bacterium]|nr:thiamine pyrophosphate-dependent enzyme [Dehalococcoidia bacterium]